MGRFKKNCENMNVGDKFLLGVKFCTSTKLFIATLNDEVSTTDQINFSHHFNLKPGILPIIKRNEAFTQKKSEINLHWDGIACKEYSDGRIETGYPHRFSVKIWLTYAPNPFHEREIKLWVQRIA